MAASTSSTTAVVDWRIMESNPDAMTRVMCNLGLPRDWSICDVLGLDDELLEMVPKPAVAVLLLLPKGESRSSPSGPSDSEARGESPNPEVYFLRQSVENSCGTVALVHAIANNADAIKIDPATPLGEFLQATKGMTPEERRSEMEYRLLGKRGVKEVAVQHYESVDVESFFSDLEVPCYHYVTFVVKGGRLYELDGCKNGPVDHGDSGRDDLLKSAARICRQYMDRDPGNVNFNVLALCSVAPT